MSTAELLVARLADRGETVATAESMTGGAVCAALVAVPGASAVVRGGVVAYTVEMKQRLLGLDASLIERAGVVSEQVATAMAAAARTLTGATFGIATTGVAGPDGHGGREAGTVCLAVAGPRGDQVATVHLPGDRDAVRTGAVEQALAMLRAAMAGDVTGL
ncbi:nicotinamide-nucleotide amidohydrolase family protein [Demequina sp. SYSU T00039]|uniref:Nicotinamide-nucleotide amidohydrolase family protein n=1 Tax=Demequina lignilytica TaxID=3051663 RepID=A0AAW7M456_9MICO|nr:MULTISPECIES: nicotinamide-nucleotide amidohydrolase family protein [unclassified Demequina]MDN4477149.1 nicotinamide-nucleotide amidohydrolase family protein [Demequina sp. SYSU T00039-1]MDN4487322.1 nicotinamide-nucleotide amidohydrolase family protein [Demequina sp. SYSU T00039]MDN4491075.1 nicotinamide-nucleotide amidohydrolase family protein [Demequina sp. SYSU T00068]